MKREAMVQELEDRGNDEGRRKLNVVEDGHNHDNDIPVRTRLKPTEMVTKGINKTQLMYEALEVVFHLPPDDPNGPGKSLYIHSVFKCYCIVTL